MKKKSKYQIVKKKDTNQKKQYPGSKLLLDVVRSEYHNVIEANDSLHSRAGITVALIVVFLGWQLGNFNNVFSLDLESLENCAYYIKILSVLTYCASIVIGVIGFLTFINVLTGKPFTRIDFENDYNAKAEYDEHLIAWHLTEKFIECVNKNDKRNRDSLNKYNRGILYTKISFFLYLGYLIFDFI